MTSDPVALWREPQVLAVSGLKRSTMRAFVKEGRFPQPVKIGERASAWVSTEIVAWVNERIDRHRLAKAA